MSAVAIKQSEEARQAVVKHADKEKLQQARAVFLRRMQKRQGGQK